MRPFSAEFFERTRELLVVFDKDNKFVEVSKPWEKILGWTIEELQTKTYMDLIHPDDLKKSLDAAAENRAGGYRGPYFVNRYLHKNGAWVWLQWDGMFGDDGRLYAIARDITPLKQKEFFFEEMQRLAKIGSWEINLETGEATISEEIYRIHELPINTPFTVEKGLSYYPEDVRPMLAAKIKNLSEKDEPYDLELPFITEKGNHRTVRISGRTLLRGGMKSLYGMCQDITEQVQKQKELDTQRLKNINASKMASLGEMAANIAHEINNPLSLIQGRAEHILSKVRSQSISGAELELGLEQVQRTSNRIAKIIKSLRAFSKSDEQSEFIKLPLRNILEDSLDLCSVRIKKDDYKLMISDIPDVDLKCRGAQLCQVFLNLINNSIEALEKREEKWIKMDFKLNRENILIEFIDSGFGIDRSIQDRIMEPFFTTKGTNGTGLGLSIASNIVSSHNGRIYYDNTKERTTFCIELPRSK